MDGYSYDAAGNVLNDGTHSYTYDAENRMIKVDNGSTATYAYDPDGHRVQKITTTGNYSDPAGTWYFFYDQSGRYVLKANSNFTFVEGQIYAGARHLASVGGWMTFSHSDWLGTERFRTYMASTPYTYESCTSLPFGDGLNCTGSDVDPLHFTGKERDSESGLDDFDARYYSSSMGRFMSPDWSTAPTGVPYADFSNPQSLNLYGYVKNNPLNATDPDGHDGWDFLAQTIGGIENAINENNGINTGSYQPSENQLGRAIGNAISVVQGGVEVLGGAAAVVTGGTEALAASPTVVGSAPGVALAGVGVVGVVHGSTVLKNALENSSSGKPYENTPENQDRMQQGKAPVGKDGKPVELHHEGQTSGQTKEMTQTEHRGGENFKKNHPNTGQQPSQIDRNQANQARRKHWKQKANEQQ
jgi:RHS repeat-associated protein